ncbi:nitroreductase family protein, partial [Bacteroides thetaiotaomicron]|nr:nitroreductase family protein [Bacteroides thetaiotaomicron]
MPSIETLLKSRVSTNKYDSARLLTDQQIDELIQLATTAPSAFNLQNWKFVAVRSAA